MEGDEPSSQVSRIMAFGSAVQHELVQELDTQVTHARAHTHTELQQRAREESRRVSYARARERDGRSEARASGMVW